MKGVFTISLDFELHWGGFEKWPLPVTGYQSQVAGHLSRVTGNYETYFLNTREVIPRMLQLFEQYGVHVTWAGVGMLMHENRKQLESNFPALKPEYTHKNLSAYNYIEQFGIGNNEEDDPFHFAHSLVEQITKTPYQELGSHTFAHYYCNEVGQTVEQFREDLRAAQKAASAYGITLRSLVFPRNQFNDGYLKACFQEGFICVRSNPGDWFWKIESTQDEGRWKRLTRGMDAYFPIGNKKTYPISSLEVRPGFPLCLPASRLLRPYRPEELFLNEMKIKRVLTELKYAARKKEIYHLWWHPHNFGNYPEESLNGLKRILAGYDFCRREFCMTSMTMGELAETVGVLYANQIA